MLVVLLPIFSQGLLEQADAVTNEAPIIATAPGDEQSPIP